MDQGKLKELLNFQVNRNVINLYKSFLITMEDMHDQHRRNYAKLKQALPDDAELIDQADYWDESRMEFLRKKIDPKIRIIDPSKALIKKFNESFAIPKTYGYESLPYENVQFFVTSDKDEFAKKVKFWLEVHKEIRLVNLRSNV